jgi:hypothetical protein
MAASAPTPVLSVLESGEAVFKTAQAFRFAYYWGLATGVWIVAAIALFFLADQLESARAGMFTFVWKIVMLFGGLPLALLNPYMMGLARRSLDHLDEFLGDFYPLWYKIRFEMLPPAGTTVDQQIWNKLRQLYPVLQRSHQVSFGTQIAGSKGTYSFEVYAKAGKHVALVRRMEGDAPVGAPGLIRLKAEADDVLKKVRGKSLVLVVLARGGFDAAAVDWARSQEGLTGKRVSSALLRYAKGQFSVVWAS